MSATFKSFYDNIAILLCIANPVFEILLIYDLFQQNLTHPPDKSFIYVSISFLVGSNVIYMIIASYWFSSSEPITNKYRKRLINICILVLVSPFIPIIIHITMTNKESFLSKLIDKYFKGYFETKPVPKQLFLNALAVGNATDDNCCEWMKWTFITTGYHWPFLLQFIIESLPHFIICCILLSHNYNNKQYISHLFIAFTVCFISFLLKIIAFSGWTISTSSIIYIIFDCCCASADFIYLFLVMSTLSTSSIIYEICYFKLIYLISILYIWSCCGLIYEGIRFVWDEIMDRDIWWKILYLTMAILAFIAVSVLIFPFFAIVFEITCFSWILVLFCFTFRCHRGFSNGQKYGAELWDQFVLFVNQSVCNKDKILRLCTVNHVLINECHEIQDDIANILIDNDDEHEYGAYLQQQKYSNLYANVTWKSFHDSSIFGKNSNIFYWICNELYFFAINFWKAQVISSWNEYSIIKHPLLFLKWNIVYYREVIYWQFICYILAPYYIISRSLNIFTICYIIYLYVFEQNEKISILFGYVYMKIILILYVVLFGVIILFGVIMIRRCYYIEWNILPGFGVYEMIESKQFNPTYNQMIMDIIHNDYYELIDIPKRENMIINVFGDNVGGIIVEYIGRFSLEQKQQEYEEKEIRSSWTINDICLIFSRSKQKWFIGKIKQIDHFNKVNELLTIRYGEHNKKTKKINRNHKYVKPLPIDHPLVLERDIIDDVFIDEYGKVKVRG
eukprot:314406_1